MINCKVNDSAEIIVGSEANFDLFLTDEEGRAIDLAQFQSGNLVFCNCDGTRTVIALTVPGTSPGAGKLSITIPSSDTANADKKWKNADVELVKAGGSTKLVLLNDKFDIVERNCPPVV